MANSLPETDNGIKLSIKFQNKLKIVIWEGGRGILYISTSSTLKYQYFVSLQVISACSSALFPVAHIRCERFKLIYNVASLSRTKHITNKIGLKLRLLSMVILKRKIAETNFLSQNLKVPNRKVQHIIGYHSCINTTLVEYYYLKNYESAVEQFDFMLLPLRLILPFLSFSLP